MSTHTPGPWEISEQYIIARSKRGLRTICQWGSYSDEPDARLIAAAPDLAEAVRELLATHPAAYRKPGKIDNRTDNAIKIARAAIAKAEGVS